MTWLLAIPGLLKRVPWPVYALVGGLLAAVLWGNHRYAQGYDASEAKHARAAAQAVAQARKADAVGVGAAQAGNDAVARSNQAARDAAAGSDDPLADGLRALKGETK